ncbi:WD40/YVTN/BNR-like repeat-containing protein [Streptomyces sp. NPDC001068]|uniref:WD40/YVTN/BNR-like repeat-containing protein n=1 Tax=Streptomyces sp. NPDC001068 TaxID=3364544 RepID=UPI0036A73692
MTRASSPARTGAGTGDTCPAPPTGVTRLALDGDDLFVGTGAGTYLVEDALDHPKTARRLPVPGDPAVRDLSAHGRVVLSSDTYGGALLSTDGGRSWTRPDGPWNAADATTYTGITATGELQVQTIGAAADGSGEKNLWVSADLGRSWRAKPQATAKVDLYSDTGSFPDRPAEQVVSASAGIYTTKNSADYRRIGVPDVQVDALAVSGPALVAGTSSGTYRSAAPLARNLPAGYQDWGWTGQAPDTVGNSVTALAAVPGTSATVLRTRSTYCSFDCFALERSLDGGRTWRQLSLADGTSSTLAVDPRHPSWLYAASYSPNGVYTSRDGGTTLLFHPLEQGEGVTSVAIDPRAPGALWIGDVTGLYRGTDSGDAAVKVFDGAVNRIAVDPSDPDHVVAVGEHLVKVSHDGGKTFRDGSGTPDLTYGDVVFAPDGTLFAASRDLYEPGGGVFRSGDGGGHWTAVVSAGLVTGDVRSLSPSPDGHWLFAGTGNAGVFRLALR